MHSRTSAPQHCRQWACNAAASKAHSTSRGATGIPTGHAATSRHLNSQLRAPRVTCRAEVEEMALSGAFDATVNSSVWERRPVPVISRLITVASEFLQWQVKYPDGPEEEEAAPSTPGTTRFRGGGGIPGSARWRRNLETRSQKARRAAAMREVLVRLGPAFVKIGQALSSRPDILPPHYLVELEALQDRIPAFSSEDAFAVLEDELGRPLPEVFSEISAEPVAAASLGQVYHARLARDGSEVAVKVQRPGVAEAIALDVYILRWLAAVFRKLRKLNTDLPALVDEWATSLFRELDYRREARNAQRFKELYSPLEGVYVPTVYTELTTAKVLTMEWVDGDRLRTVADNLSDGRDSGSAGSRRNGSGSTRGGASGSKRGSEEDLALVEVGVRCSLEQMLEEGFYHADPHPGNLLRTRDGRLAYLDFGMCGELDIKTRQALIRATLHLVNREYGHLAQDFIDLGLLPPGSDKEKIIPALTGVFASALARGVSNVSFGDLSGQLGRTMYQFSFRIPPYYTLLVRSLTVLEGIALASNPNYKVLGSAYPWIARRLLTNQTPELQATLRALLYTPAGSFRFARLESLLQEAVRTPTRLPPPLSAGMDSRPNPAAQGSALNLLLSPDASFVRGILIDEVAKGVDAAWRVGLDTAVQNALHPLPAVARVPVFGPVLVPLLAPFTTSTKPWSPWPAPNLSGGLRGSKVPDAIGFQTSHASAEDAYLGGPLGSLLAALPTLSARSDYEQLEGMRRLLDAVSALAAARRPQGSARAGDIGEARVELIQGSAILPHTSPDLAALSVQLEDTILALRWLVAELGSLPEAQRAEAFKLPGELAVQVGSRVTARALRAAVGASDESDDTLPGNDTLQEGQPQVVTTVVTSRNGSVAMRPILGMMGGMQEALEGTSIV